MLFRRQTSEPTGSVAKTPGTAMAHSTSSSGILSSWYSKITTNVKKRQPFSPKSLLKKALLPVVDPFLEKVSLSDLSKCYHFVTSSRRIDFSGQKHKFIFLST
ncbi:uncharacterized protein LOC144478206 [Augochlora pura]